VGERLEGKVCIVTGAPRGIAAAYARALARESADVAIIGLKRVAQAGPVVDDIEALGRRAFTIEADVSDAEPIVDPLVQTSALKSSLEPEDMTGQVLINDAGAWIGAV
jgi:3-oxoacyl-[acyl-carrier protein] reductase